jgi:hypothetical protein
VWQPKQHQNSIKSNVSCKDKTYWGTTSLYYKKNIIQLGNVDLAPAKTLENVYKISKAIQNIVLDVYLFISKSAFLLISRKYHIYKLKKSIYLHSSHL